jgi:hypothetical protein
LKKSMKTTELELILEIPDKINISLDNEKTKAENFQNNFYDTFTYVAVRQVEKFR